MICITGGHGFIGSHLAKALPEAKLFDYPNHDLRNIEHAEDFIYHYKPETVYHLAAQSVVTNHDDLETLDTNIVGTYNLLHACKEIGGVKSFVHISTDKVYGTNANARRTDVLRGIGDPYTVSMHCGDLLAQNYSAFWGLPIHIIRTANIYGPNDKHLDRLIPGTIVDTLNGIQRKHRGDPRFIRDFIYVEDLIPAYIKIASEPPGIFNLGGDHFSIRDVTDMITRLMKSEHLPPIWEKTQKNEIPFQHITDCPDWWHPQTTLEDGIRKTIEWYNNNK